MCSSDLTTGPNTTRPGLFPLGPEVRSSAALTFTQPLLQGAGRAVNLAPVVIALFAHYLALSMQPGSSAQKPEKLIRERGLMALVALLTALFVLLTFVNVPALEPLAGQKYISIQ